MVTRVLGPCDGRAGEGVVYLFRLSPTMIRSVPAHTTSANFSPNSPAKLQINNIECKYLVIVAHVYLRYMTLWLTPCHASLHP